MKRISYILFSLSLLISFSSCEDYLTEVNPSAITTDNFWRNLDDCEKGMVAVYNQFGHPNLMQLSAESMRTDMAYPGYQRPSPTNSNAVYYNQIFTSADNAPNDKWAELYRGVFRANQVIQALDRLESEMDTDEKLARWTELKGEAHFFRGLFHFWLHSSFNRGKIAIMDKVAVDPDEFFNTVSSEAEVRKFFQADLQYAYETLSYLPTTAYSKEYMPSDVGAAARASKGAAAMALAQSYLYQPTGADYKAAKGYLEDIIQNGPYTLVDVDMNITTYGEFNQESILEISYDRDLKKEENNIAYGTFNQYARQLVAVGGWRTHVPSLWLTMAYKEDPMDESDPRNKVEQTDGSLSQRVYNQRASASIALIDDTDRSWYGCQYPGNAGLWNCGVTSYFRKQTNYDICENEDTEFQHRSGVNYRVMRLADVYLLYAECLIQGGQDQGGISEAIAYINKVRHRSALRLLGTAADGEFPDFGDGVNYSTYTGGDIEGNPITTAQQVMDHLMYWERPLELSLEGYATRQIDLRRWGKTKERLTELASKSYYGVVYDCPDEEDETKTSKKWGGILVHGVNPNADGDTWVDHTVASNNYIESFHDYWPIPSKETMANPFIEGK